MLRGTTQGTAGGLAVIALMAVGTSVLVSWKMRGDTTELRGPLSTEIARGSLMGLGRAQAIGRRVIISDPDDAESAALLAFTSALLATEFGQGTVNEAESAAARAMDALGRGKKDDSTARSAAIAGAASALVALRRGDFDAALARATAAAAAAPGVPHPRVALGRVRAATGDLVGASRALEAAMVEAPQFLPAQLVWAEVHVDLGDAAGAAAVLALIVAKAPEDIRARLLLDEATRALAMAPVDPKAPSPSSVGLTSACTENGVLPPYTVAGCALALSSGAHATGDHLTASAQARAAARALPDEPRMLARAAQLVAETGAIDKAAKLVERATHFARPAAPTLAWARLAETLGHGRSATAPPGLRPNDGTTRVLAARASFAAGGVGALASTLDGLGAPVVERDADLTALRRLTLATAPAADAAPGGGAPSKRLSPADAYLAGVRARLDGDMSLAAERLSHALAGHADACRAAGEYVAALRALKRHADPGAFAPLRAENAGCVNLPAL